MAKAPCTGLNAKRNDSVINFSWLLPAGKTKKNGTLQYKLLIDGKAENKVSYKSVTLRGTTIMPNSYALTLDRTKYCPSKNSYLNSIAWRVQMSGLGYSEVAKYTFGVPDKPKLWTSGSSIFWSTDQNAIDNNIWFQDIEYQTTNSGSSGQPDWTAASVTSGTGQASGSQSFSDSNGYRHFRARVRAVNGVSEWAYIYKNCSVPASLSGVSGRLNGDVLTVNFVASSEAETADIYYTTGKPGSNFSCPVGASWTQGYTCKKVNGGSNTVSFKITPPTANQGLWIRVDLNNASHTTEGSVVYVTNGGLTEPIITAFSIDLTAKTITIDFTETSAISGVMVAAVDSNGTILKKVAGTVGTVTCDYAVTDTIEQQQFGVYAYYEGGGVKAESQVVIQTVESALPSAPTNLTVNKTGTPGKVVLSWTNRWGYANGTVIAWADDPDAWMSTSDPNEYEVKGEVSSYYVIDLETGKKWYFRIRSVHFAVDDSDKDFYGPWCGTTAVIDLSEVPDKPAIWLDKAIIAPGDAVTVNWGYLTNDGTEQSNVTIYVDNVPTYEVEGTVQSYTFIPDWANGSSHTIRVKTVAMSGQMSELSDAKTIAVADELVTTVTTSLVNGRLTTMPLSFSAEGAGLGGKTIVNIIRVGSYVAGRPDESRSDGFDGETIFTKAYTGNVTDETITIDDLIGKLDEGCDYKLEIVISDNLGQTTVDETKFTVEWDHQPEIPSATVVIEDRICKITPIAPESAVSSDTCDIYRLSKDKPVLIVKGAVYGETYVDPYPASGGGYRVVDITANGDYIGEIYPAWADYEHGLTFADMIFESDGYEISLPYNITLQSEWKKDFERTVYLNGQTQGDWNPGVTRDSTYTTVIQKGDGEMMSLIRNLAELSGICHVRTPEGSSYAANVNVTESGSYDSIFISYNISVQRVDPEGLDGMTLEDWEEEEG